MPAVGLLLGRQLSGTFGDWAHVIGGLLLIAVGVEAMVAALAGPRTSGPGARRRSLGTARRCWPPASVSTT